MRRLRRKGRQTGFTLIETMVVCAILVLVLGAAFSQMNLVNWRLNAEKNRLDATQETREFLDQIARDVHQAGYPSSNLYTSVTVASGVPTVCTNGTYTNPLICSQKVAAGLVKLSPTELLFEGDLYGNGNIESVHYILQTSGGTCPCTLQRSSIVKSSVGDGDPLTSYTPSYTIELQNVVNSDNAYTISGTSTFTYGGTTTIANDTLYSVYKAAPIFQGLDINGVDQGTQSISTSAGQQALAKVVTVRIVINVLANPADVQTQMRSAVSMVGDAVVGDNF